MSTPGSTRDLARWLLDRAMEEEGTGDVPAAVDRASRRLVADVERWIGADSAEVLLSQALHAAGVRHPALRAVRRAGEGNSCFAGLAEALSAPGADGGEPRALGVLVAFVEILASFVGDVVAVRMVAPDWSSRHRREKETE